MNHQRSSRYRFPHEPGTVDANIRLSTDGRTLLQRPSAVFEATHEQGCLRSRTSPDQILHHMPVDVRQPVVPALETVGELFVVEAELVEDGGLEIVDVDALVDD